MTNFPWFEYLEIEKDFKAINNLKQLLCKNVKISFAVPDGYHPNEDYINTVKPNGTGGADHKVLYNYKSIKQFFDTDFKIKYQEYFDEKKNFKYNNWYNDNVSG
jgi:predicted SAM-dependent methyltransferase